MLKNCEPRYTGISNALICVLKALFLSVSSERNERVVKYFFLRILRLFGYINSYVRTNFPFTSFTRPLEISRLRCFSTICASKNLRIDAA